MANDEEAIKRRYREFVDLLPLTLSLAGLPTSEGKPSFTSEQIELRAQVIVNAYRVARQTVREIIKSGT